MVSGAVALLLHEPNLTPDQGKYRLMAPAISTSTPRSTARRRRMPTPVSSPAECSLPVKIRWHGTA
ncbi:MAG: hypothetical protein R3E79_50670 [Caldilineaceae bacterium]